MIKSRDERLGFKIFTYETHSGGTTLLGIPWGPNYQGIQAVEDLKLIQPRTSRIRSVRGIRVPSCVAIYTRLILITLRCEWLILYAVNILVIIIPRPELKSEGAPSVRYRGRHRRNCNGRDSAVETIVLTSPPSVGLGIFGGELRALGRSFGRVLHLATKKSPKEGLGLFVFPLNRRVRSCAYAAPPSGFVMEIEGESNTRRLADSAQPGFPRGNLLTGRRSGLGQPKRVRIGSPCLYIGGSLVDAVSKPLYRIIGIPDE
ncbi:hypothetical protein F5Y00DRAFT_258874 [Daldinia vernicosa]|uniref:uncharacterized protein n=1 Tax=Daldinia vernicosa TaxID=114800 RepID=UPI0020078DB2|nr:uncharacterized protein F5Y00DRAFT_258874 [Daldinia vernicosa]KAI0851918.1 hypothetical protein F5Y00DRAFT_258874 [Daldinia vernicosa]